MDSEHKLPADTRRLEREFAALQKDADLAPAARPAPVANTAAPFGGTSFTATPFSGSPFSGTPFSTDLQAIATQLAERANALDIRERMLQEMESLLLSQVTPPPAHRSPPGKTHPAHLAPQR